MKKTTEKFIVDISDPEVLLNSIGFLSGILYIRYGIKLPQLGEKDYETAQTVINKLQN